MRIVSWNMRMATEDSPSWKYFQELDPQIALLQEVCEIPPAIGNEFSVVHRKNVNETGREQTWGTAILVKGDQVAHLQLATLHELIDAQLRKFSGKLVGGIFRLGDHPRFHVLSIHAPDFKILLADEIKQINRDESVDIRLTGYEDLYFTEIVWYALSQRLKAEEVWVFGGDLNCSVTFDEKTGLTGNRQVLDRFENLGLHECLRETHQRVVPTFRHFGGSVEHQLDHLFVTDGLYQKLHRCETGDEQRVFQDSLSDHLPIIADFA